MSEQYLVDTHGNTIGIVLDPDTYHELVQAREELRRIRTSQGSQVAPGEGISRQHSIRELRGLGKETWMGLDVQQYIREERDAWGG